MAPNRWPQVAAIVEDALPLQPSLRLEYARRACGADTDLYRQVESLLAHHHEEEALRAAAPGATVTHGPAPETTWVHSRFNRLECLGAGGFGTVYRAFDRERAQWVALKTLRNVDPDRLDRFKQEFRRTTAIRHRNVVQMYELFAEGDQWFFTMELVDGVPLLEYIRGPKPWATTALSSAAWDRLQLAFEQLVDGVSVLHASGIVHGDLKPQNILVTRESRLVLLDFGMVREIAQQPSLVAGTPAYMSPEQFAQAPGAEAADWYSVGVLLYEAMTTKLVFTGTFWEIVRSKQDQDISLSADEDVPAPLLTLCEALLHRDPAKRPSGKNIADRLVERGHAREGTAKRVSRRVFVGRQEQLRTLREAYDRVRSGRPTCVHLHGPSGIGKSTLVRQFLDIVRHEYGDGVVLAGRCYEAESVPFKALDELIDGLSRYLGRLPARELSALLPKDLSLLTRVFPALQRVINGERSQRLPSEARGYQELRDRALTALQELLRRLAERQPLVLWVDDLQWGDRDSARVLRDLQEPSHALPLLLIVSYRAEDIGASAVLQELAAAADRGIVQELAVGELAREDAGALIDQLCGGLSEAQRTAIVTEAQGSPLFLQELAHHVTTVRSTAERRPRLSEMIQQRVDTLPPAARRLLEVIAISGQPLARRIAIRAAHVDDPGAESLLIAEFLVRAAHSSAAGELDTYHDKVREAVLALMSEDDRRLRHERVARALEMDGSADPERLVQHFTHAGIEDEAYRCALRAADAAEHGLAFDQAVSLYRHALRLHDRVATVSPAPIIAAGRDAIELRCKLARALGNAGRCADSADAYLDAAKQAGADQSGELRSLAVDQLMRSGQINEGLSLLTATLRERGFHIPRSRTRLIAAVTATRMRVRLRGLSFRERRQTDLPPEMLTRIDTLWTAGATLTAIDPVLGSYLRGQHLLAALRAGEPCRVSVGLALEAIQRVLGGAHAYPTARRILDRAREIALQCGQPYAEAMVLTAEAGVAYYSGRVRDAFRYGMEGEELLKARCTGVAWELAACRMWILSALVLSGEWKEYGRRLQGILHEAERNGDRYAQCAVPLSTGCFAMYLAADDAASARRILDEKIAQWGRREFDVPRASHWFGTVEILRHERRYEEAWQLVTSTWPLLRRNLILRVEFLRFLAEQARARCAVALHSVAPRPELLRVAERFVSRSARSSSTLVQGSGLLVDAALTVFGDRPELAVAKLQLAEDRLRNAGALQIAAASRRRRGELVGGAAGAALIEEADAELVELGATHPQRTSERFVPGNFPLSR